MAKTGERTKTRIKQIALECFNEAGVAGVTIRDIAKKAGMSPGNLCYHFPNTEAIAFALYRDLVEISSQGIQQAAGNSGSDNPLRSLFQATEQVMQLQVSYRFVLLDMVHMARLFPDFQKDFRQLQQQRLAELQQLWQLMVEKGILRQAHDDEVLALLVSMRYIMNHWLPEAVAMGKDLEKAAKETLWQLLTLLKIHLTEKGKSEWHALE